MDTLGEEREFLAEATRNLDTSLKERESLLLQVAEAKSKVMGCYSTSRTACSLRTRRHTILNRAVT